MSLESTQIMNFTHAKRVDCFFERMINIPLEQYILNLLALSDSITASHHDSSFMEIKLRDTQGLLIEGVAYDTFECRASYPQTKAG